MSTTSATKIDLLLLGLLLDRPMHGYELYQQIQAEEIDAWFNVSMAGVYYSLGKLRDQSLVVESRQRGGRSARKSIYRLTDEGRAAFFAAMEKQWAWLTDVIRNIQGQEEGSLAGGGERRGLMILSGDLRHYHLPDLLRLIVSGRHSGTLTVTDGVQIRTLSFQDGQPVCATSRRRDEPADAAQTPESVMEGICDLFRWQEGRFTLDQEMSSQAWCVPLTLSAEDLILCGCRWVDNWTIIQRLIPSADAIFELGTAFHRQDSLTLTPLEERIVKATDGVKDVTTIARELQLTVFEASRAFYCLTAVGVVRTADLDKIRLRRVFREIAELMCSSTIAWRSSPDDRSCEQEVNQLTEHLPLCLNRGRIEDQAEPKLNTDELVEMYRGFLISQLDVVSRRFGRDNARQSFERTLRQLAPELQEVAKRYGFDQLLAA
jgi:DNA-binding PadR family transcriptional regulator